MGKPDLTEEELKRLLEEQKKKVEAMLAAMTPEERADAEKKFAAMREADEAAMRKTLDDARKVMEMNTAQEHVRPRRGTERRRKTGPLLPKLRRASRRREVLRILRLSPEITMKTLLLIAGIVLAGAGVLALSFSALNLFGFRSVLDGSPELYAAMHRRFVIFCITGVLLAAGGAVCLFFRFK